MPPGSAALQFSSPVYVPDMQFGHSHYRGTQVDGLRDEPTEEDDGNNVADSGEESVDESDYMAGSEALDTSPSDYPPGFRPGNTTASFEGKENTHVSQEEDTPVHTSASIAIVNTELSAPLTDDPTNLAVSRVATDGFTTVVSKQTRRRISEKHKQQEIQKAITASVSRAPRTRRNQAGGSK